MYKFRSMYTGAEAGLSELKHLSDSDGPAFKLKNGPEDANVDRGLSER